MNTSIAQLKTALAAARAQLIADGWEHLLSVIHDGSGREYGALYTRTHPVLGKMRFYLNKDTLNELPIIGA